MGAMPTPPLTGIIRAPQSNRKKSMAGNQNLLIRSNPSDSLLTILLYNKMKTNDIRITARLTNKICKNVTDATTSFGVFRYCRAV